MPASAGQLPGKNTGLRCSRPLGIAKACTAGDGAHVDISALEDDVTGTHRRAAPSLLRTLRRGQEPGGGIQVNPSGRCRLYGAHGRQEYMSPCSE